MSTRTTVLWVADWPVVAAATTGEVAGHLPVAVHDGQRLTAVSALARAQGVRRGMRRRQAQGCCPELVLLVADDVRDVRLFEPVASAAESVVAGVEVVRPGMLLLPAGGASRYHGSEDALADRLVDAVAQRAGHECGVGTADGLLAAVLAARTGALVAPGRSAAFLADRGVGELVHAAVTDEVAVAVADLVDLLNRLGLRTLGRLAALPAADVHARFGRLGAWAHLLARGDDERPPARRRPEADLEVVAELEPPADRVDTATFVGRRLAEDLHDLLVQHAVTCGRLQIAARTDEGEDLVRTWRTDLGGWGGLTPARITDRIRWQLEGWLTSTAVTTARSQAADARAAGVRRPTDPHDDWLPDPGPDHDAQPVALVRLAVTALDVAPAGAEQGRLWGGPSGGDLRAHRALDRVQGLVGGSGLLTATLQGGRDLRDQVHLRPWGEQAEPPRPLDRPWPGRLPEPAPATVLDPPRRVEVRDVQGRPVLLDVRTGLSGAPAWVRMLPDEAEGDEPPRTRSAVRGVGGRLRPMGQGDGARSAGARPGDVRTGDDPRPRKVAGWAGPWLQGGRWWAAPPGEPAGTSPASVPPGLTSPGPRSPGPMSPGPMSPGPMSPTVASPALMLRAHLQVTFDDGPAVLLACASDGWTCEATYD